jgi:hypothetical protein
MINVNDKIQDVPVRPGQTLPVVRGTRIGPLETKLAARRSTQSPTRVKCAFVVATDKGFVRLGDEFRLEMN